MKKSKIIIPALAMIAFSVAAAATGTVAWFTANRTANINAGTYAVVKTTANLACSVAPGVGTSATDNDPGVADVISVSGQLTDGSFDHDGSNHYIYAPDSSGTKVGKRTALTDANLADEIKRGTIADADSTQEGNQPADIFTAVTWDMTFSITFPSTNSGNIGLFLDVVNSSFTPSNESVTEANKDTAKGFRMAFVPQGTNASSGKTHVFADLQDNTLCKYIGGEPAVNAVLASSATSYDTAEGSHVLIDKDEATALASSYTTSAAGAMPNYFGVFTFAAEQTVQLSFKVVCWFEGTDPNIENGDAQHVLIMRSVTAALQFSAINLED